MCEKQEKTSSLKEVSKNEEAIDFSDEKTQIKYLGLTEKGLSRLLKDILK